MLEMLNNVRESASVDVTARVQELKTMGYRTSRVAAMADFLAKCRASDGTIMYSVAFNRANRALKFIDTEKGELKSFTVSLADLASDADACKKLIRRLKADIEGYNWLKAETGAHGAAVARKHALSTITEIYSLFDGLSFAYDKRIVSALAQMATGADWKNGEGAVKAIGENLAFVFWQYVQYGKVKHHLPKDCPAFDTMGIGAAMDMLMEQYLRNAAALYDPETGDFAEPSAEQNAAEPTAEPTKTSRKKKA